jgi:hypothetical protein
LISRKKRLRYRTNAIRIAAERNVPLNAENWEEIWAILETHEEPSFLYAIVDPSLNLVKFGKSKNPGLRLKTLEIGNGSRLKLWGFCLHKSPFTEKEIHKLLRSERVVGEWFKLGTKSGDVISKMQQSARLLTPCQTKD